METLMQKINEHDKSYLGYIFAIISIIIWSGNFVAARFLTHLSPVEISFYRWFITLVMLTPFCINPLIKNIKLIKGMWPTMIIISILGISVFNALVYMAAHTSNATNMSLLATLSPIIVVILGKIFFKSKLNFNQIIGLIVVIFGVVVLITKGNIVLLLSLNFAVGDIYMLFAVLLFSIYTITLRLRPKGFPQSTFFYLMVVIGIIPLAVIMSYKSSLGTLYKLDLQTSLILIYIGLFPSALGFILWNMAIEKIGEIKASIIYDSIPMFTTLEAMILLKETLLISQVVGGCLILAGIIYASIGNKILNKT